jgi:hypothetical protein
VVGDQFEPRMTLGDVAYRRQEQGGGERHRPHLLPQRQPAWHVTGSSRLKLLPREMDERTGSRQRN